MNTYPRFFTLQDSTAVTASGVEPLRATNGALKVRRMWPADKATFQIGHVLTTAEKTTLDAFYAAEKDADVSYVSPWDSTTYTVRFVAPPQYIKRLHRVEARVSFQQV